VGRRLPCGPLHPGVVAQPAESCRRFGWPRAVALTVVVLIVCAALFVLTNQQPQRKAFALLETPPASLSQAQSLLKQQDSIRAGLLNAYLAPLRISAPWARCAT